MGRGLQGSPKLLEECEGPGPKMGEEAGLRSGNAGKWWNGSLEGRRGQIIHCLLGHSQELDFILNENKWIYSHISEKPLNCCRQRNNRFWFAFERYHGYPATAVWTACRGACERQRKDQVGSSDALNALKTRFLSTVFITVPFVMLIIVLICISLSRHQDCTFLTTKTVRSSLNSQIFSQCQGHMWLSVNIISIEYKNTATPPSLGKLPPGAGRELALGCLWWMIIKPMATKTVACG